MAQGSRVNHLRLQFFFAAPDASCRGAVVAPLAALWNAALSMVPPIKTLATVAFFACLGPAACAADPIDEDGPDPWADRLVSFSPGPQAGFGAAGLPGVVLGPPRGAGAGAGSTDVVSLGRAGTIVLAFDDIGLVDGPGPDLLVFENPFADFTETGRVAVSEDGQSWHAWPCTGQTSDPLATCAGLQPVLGDGTTDLQDAAKMGGDAFDLAAIGVARARFVRIEDTGHNAYEGISGGFDLDGVAVRNGAPLK